MFVVFIDHVFVIFPFQAVLFCFALKINRHFMKGILEFLDQIVEMNRISIYTFSQPLTLYIMKGAESMWPAVWTNRRAFSDTP